ncbi:hypothetical protein Tco_0737005 [Tanacetum coccineum]
MHETSVPVYMDVVEKADPFACNQTQNLGSFTSQMASSDMLSTIRGNHIATPSPASFDIRNCCSDQPTNTSCITDVVPTEEKKLQPHTSNQLQLEKTNYEFTIGSKQEPFPERKNVINNDIKQSQTCGTMSKVRCQKKSAPVFQHTTDYVYGEVGNCRSQFLMLKSEKVCY